MSEHTPGRLEVAVQVFDNDGCPETVIQGIGGAASVAVALDFGSNNPGMREANARRLVACWNALADLPQDALDGGWTRAGLEAYGLQMKAERDSLRAVNAELLEALEGLVSVYDAMNNPRGPKRIIADAAIASARKQGDQG